MIKKYFNTKNGDKYLNKQLTPVFKPCIGYFLEGLIKDL